MGGGGTNTNTIQNSSPWAPQTPYIMQGLDQASQNYQTASAAGPYTGNFVAQGNGYDTQAEQAAGSYANGAGAAIPGQEASVAGALLNPNSATNYTNTAQGIANNGIGPQNSPLMNTLQNIGTGAQTTQGATPALSAALNQAGVTGANSLNGFTGGLSGAAAQAATDPTQQVMTDAQQYANSPQLQAAIASTNAQIGQTLHEQTLPGLNQQAAMGGSLNSSRAGMAEGMANEGAGIAMGNADAQLQNNALNAGLSTASGLYQSNLSQAVNANAAGVNDVGGLANTVGQNQTALNLANTSNEMTAANTGINAGINYGTANANAQLAGNSQVLSGLSAGNQAAQSGLAAAQGNASLLSGAGQLQTSTDQAALQNQLDQWNMQNQYQTGILNNYMAVAGTPLGTTGSTSGTSGSSGPGILAGGVGAAAGLNGLFGSNGVFPGAGAAAINGIGGLIGDTAMTGALGAGVTAGASGLGLASTATAAGATALSTEAGATAGGAGVGALEGLGLFAPLAAA